MNLIESLQIDAPRMTSDNTCIAKMNLTEFHKQPQGYLNGGATSISYTHMTLPPNREVL